MSECLDLSVRDLDRTSGNRLHFIDIANPRLRGEIAKRISSPALLSRDEIEADTYAQEVSRLGREAFLQQRETEELASLLGLDLEELPCLAFVTRPLDRVVTFRIDRTWYGSKDACWIFIDCLKQWLSSELRWLDAPSFTVQSLQERFEKGLVVLRTSIDEALRGKASSSDCSNDTLETQFKCVDGVWRIVYGGTTILEKDTVGLRYLAILLRHPARWILALTVRNIGSGASEEAVAIEASEVSDAKTLEAVRAEMKDLDKKIDVATRAEDFDAAARLDEERAQLEAHLRKICSRSGQIRQFTDADERARQSVTIAIKRAIEPFEDRHPTLHSHLRNSLKFGREICYQPETPPLWDV